MSTITFQDAKAVAALSSVLDPILPPELLDLVFRYLFVDIDSSKQQCDPYEELSLNDFLSTFCSSLHTGQPRCGKCESVSQWLTLSFLHNEETESMFRGELGDGDTELFHFWCDSCLFDEWNDEDDSQDSEYDHRLNKYSHEYSFWKWKLDGSLRPYTHKEMLHQLEEYNKEREKAQDPSESESEQEESEQEEQESEQEESEDEKEENEQEHKTHSNFFT